ncbi:MAG TPA: flagellar export chaperone FlgN [Opitutaceae bacterium]|nr:flagellar export chaperone FlgN [Opitutaceae bacterium]
MSTSWHIITERLRNELQEYGALLGLFEEQQSNLLRRDANAVVELASEIEDQARVAQSTRDLREEAIRKFAFENKQPANSSLRHLLPYFPADVQPLIQALIGEINHLIHRVRRDARQNQILLSRTVEAYEEAVRTLRPEAFAKTYSSRGSIPLANVGVPVWQAAG